MYTSSRMKEEQFVNQGARRQLRMHPASKWRRTESLDDEKIAVHTKPSSSPNGGDVFQRGSKEKNAKVHLSAYCARLV